MDKQYNLFLISDFTADMLGSLLRKERDEQALSVSIAPFDQVIPVLLDSTLPEWNEADIAVVWTLPERAVPGFQKLQDGESYFTQNLLDEVGQFVALIEQAATRVKALFVPLWVHAAHDRGLGLLDLRDDTGLGINLMRMNLHLMDRLKKVPNAYVLNTQRWIEKCGNSAFSPKLWYMGKIPFSPPVFVAASADIQDAVKAIHCAPRKLIVLDLDDTLWGGIVGDAGIDGIVLGAPDPVGEGLVDFQRSLKALTRRGIILALASKNEESVALEVFKNHPEMVLRLDDISAWRINWGDKAENIVELAEELNLGLQSVVFIDDNPVERDRVRESLPEVFVPEWPKDKTLYNAELKKLSCFDQIVVSEEDRGRSEMYAAERERKQEKRELGSLEDWIASLDMQVFATPVSEQNIARTVQLMNKTNQMNLKTRRTTEAELKEWLVTEDRELWTFRVTDKFGDQGLTGIVGLEFNEDSVELTDFILSCRVMGRKVEETILHVAIDRARNRDLGTVVAPYEPTAKNKPCKSFFEKVWATSMEGGKQIFSWDTSRELALQDGLNLIYDQHAEGGWHA